MQTQSVQTKKSYYSLVLTRITHDEDIRETQFTWVCRVAVFALNKTLALRSQYVQCCHHRGRHVRITGGNKSEARILMCCGLVAHPAKLLWDRPSWLL